MGKRVRWTLPCCAGDGLPDLVGGEAEDGGGEAGEGVGDLVDGGLGAAAGGVEVLLVLRGRVWRRWGRCRGGL